MPSPRSPDCRLATTSRTHSPRAQCDPQIRESNLISQPASSTEHANVEFRQVWAHIGRHDARLPRRRLSRGRLARVVDHLRTPEPLARLRELPALTSAGPRGFPLRPGHRLWWRGRFLPPPNVGRKGLEKSISRFFVRPQGTSGYPHVGACYPPVVHRFVHTPRPGRGPDDNQRRHDCTHRSAFDAQP